ncbi:MAG: lysine--tRNA ligase [Planctomycetota bacterium]
MPDAKKPAKPQKSDNQLLGDRRNKLKRLRDEFGMDPYGQRTAGIIDIADARGSYNAEADEAFKSAEDPSAAEDTRAVVAVAGRVVQHRVMGNLIFLSLRDHSGDIQIAASKKTVGQPDFGLAKMTDYGDLVTARGALGTTKTGEVTVWAGEGFELSEDNPAYRITTKSLALPPGKHHGLTDPETRYRKRYVDLYSNPEVMQTMQLRIRIIDAIRDYLRGKGYMEVETPMLQSIHGGAAARPFHTHHNALDIPLTLRIAPELYLKRLLVGGMPKVFEINRNFRNEGISPRHNPEFTMLEAYEAYSNWETMAELVEDMTCTVAEQIFGTLKIEHKNAEGEVTRTIDLTRPWRRVSMAELVKEKTGWEFDKTPLKLDGGPQTKLLLVLSDKGKLDDLKDVSVEDLNDTYKRFGVDAYLEHLKPMSPAEQLTEVYEKLIEPKLIDPCFVTRVPSVIIPLAKKCADDDYFADVYELAINGVEISPGYTELNDPAVQEANFREQVGDDEEKQQIDEDFLEALRVGMPPAGGMGLGIDRLVMMLTGAESIRDVILFPLMKPQGE